MITLRLISLLGILTFLGLAWAMSTHRNNIPWRVVGWGMGLQLIIALLVFQKFPITPQVHARIREELGARAVASGPEPGSG